MVACEHDLRPLYYIYNNRGDKTNRVWTDRESPLQLCYCDKCRQVVVATLDYEFEPEPVYEFQWGFK